MIYGNSKANACSDINVGNIIIYTTKVPAAEANGVTETTLFDGSIKALQNVTGIGKNSKVFLIFDKYGTKTGKTIGDVVGLIGG